MGKHSIVHTLEAISTNGDVSSIWDLWEPFILLPSIWNLYVETHEAEKATPSGILGLKGALPSSSHFRWEVLHHKHVQAFRDSSFGSLVKAHTIGQRSEPRVVGEELLQRKQRLQGPERE
jgi:hypothetical protein